MNSLSWLLANYKSISVPKSSIKACIQSSSSNLSAHFINFPVRKCLSKMVLNICLLLFCYVNWAIFMGYDGYVGGNWLDVREEFYKA